MTAKSDLLRRLKKYKTLYLFLIPAVVLAIIFSYIPIAGVLIAFKDSLNLYIYTPLQAFVNAEWTMMHFEKLFSSEDFLRVLWNTLIISFLKIVILFPLPVFLAIMVSEVKSRTYNKVIQSILYLPHFLSWAVITGMFMSVLDPTTGIVNQILFKMGIMNPEEPVYWFGSNVTFRGLIVFMSGWKEIGWSAITYIAAILSIDTSLFEAAKIDGAGKFRQIFSIIIPSIMSTIMIMLIIRIGYLMEAGFEQIYTMLSPLVYRTGDIIGTYVFRLAMGDSPQYEFSTAVGLFNSTVALVFVLGGNYASKKLSGQSIW